MKMQIQSEMKLLTNITSQMLKLSPVMEVSENMSLEYADRGGSMVKRMTETDRNRERERLKEQLLPFLRDTVKKMLKEEREYYKSRPSQAAQQVERVLGARNIQNILAPTVAKQVYAQMEERARWEWLRKGR